MALKSDAEEDRDSEGPTVRKGSKRKPKRRQLSGANDVHTSCISDFSASLRDTERIRIALNEKRLSFEERRQNEMMVERAMERAESTKERAKQREDDMERIPTMMDFSTKAITACIDKLLKKCAVSRT